MTHNTWFRVDRAPQSVQNTSVNKETPEERFRRLKRQSDATGKRFVQVYLEDERQRQKRDQR